ncbi:MAG: 5-formyltetrahydrofolate cyclo-ligase [Caulobacteraceae bacterium]
MSLPPDSLASSKLALRARMRALRRRLAADNPRAAQGAAQLIPVQLLVPGVVVGGYHPLGGEMDPCPLLRRFAQAGARIVLPAATRRDAALTFRAGDGALPFETDAFGIPAPPAAARAFRPDLLFAPVLAFDRAGGRLGQGAGCYDRTLAALRRTGPLFVIGLAYAGQEVERAPAGPRDQPLDAILTETAYMEVGKDP